jgi:predicted metal-dependent phosphoesterase TrpH
MKCDLHVHSIHSGMCTVPLLKRICRESYNDPQAVYSTLKRKGMDLVTLTDHDSVGAAESLRCHADFFLSEEVTCRMPSGTTVHIGVFDITERQHIEIQRRRDDSVCSLISASVAFSSA